MKQIKRIAIIGGGPSGLFLFKRLIDSDQSNLEIEIFERKDAIGAGMPYSHDGANDEHITNVSSNEIPMLVSSLAEWIQTISPDTLNKYHIDPEKFNEYKVLPRLLFGQYLQDQFNLLQQQAKEKGVDFTIHYKANVLDVIDEPTTQTVQIILTEHESVEVDHAVICTGHNWPEMQEQLTPGYFDSPYPPQKIAAPFNHPVAIKGASLTAVDAVRTLARYNGVFEQDNKGKLSYRLHPGHEGFSMVMHSRSGFLPAVRFHLEDSHLKNDDLLTKQEIHDHIAENDGFLSIDYVFEQDFKLPIKEKDPEFYARIKDMSLEDFVADMLELRERIDPFLLMKAEYIEAEKSIRRQESIYWKEMLGVLSFALNYPAKYLSAEDMLRLHHTLSPLISIVIAYIPQSSCEEMMALHDVGLLSLIAVDANSQVTPHEKGGASYVYTDESGINQNIYYKTFIDCTGQPQIPFKDFPFKSLISDQSITPARLKFRLQNAANKAIDDGKEVIKDINGHHYLTVSGVAINDHFQAVDAYGAFNERIYILAVPYIGGYNPDYSGLDFCEAASAAVVKGMMG